MNDAGKITFVPKGAYEADTMYEALDVVTDNGMAWAARKNTKGNAPTEGEYWMCLVTSAGYATIDTAGIVKPDGTTITVDPDGTIHGQSKVDEMTGATEEKDGTSGTIPAPKAGQQAYMLGGDGTWKSPLENEIIDAKIKELNKSIEDAIALRASLEAYGMIKLCDSSAVTDSTGLALPATEKNASIEGTLAAQIASLNTDFAKDLGSLTTNLLNPVLDTKTSNGVTCTNNGDGTYTLNGTATNDAKFYVVSQSISNNAGDSFLLTGCPKGGTANTFYLVFTRGLSYQTWANDYGNGGKVTFTAEHPDSGGNAGSVVIIIKSGYSCDNLLFKPMLTTNLNATYNDFVQYTGGKGRLNLDVADLYAKFTELSSRIETS